MNISKKIYMAIVIGIISLLIININGYCIERYKAFMSNDYERLKNVKKGICYIPFSFICS